MRALTLSSDAEAAANLLQRCAGVMEMSVAPPDPWPLPPPPVPTRGGDATYIEPDIRSSLPYDPRLAAPDGSPGGGAPSPQAGDVSPAAERSRAAGPEQSPFELRLYVSSQSVHCHRAQRALRQVLQGMPAAVVSFAVIDVGREPELAEKDRILFTPTLILRDGQGRTTHVLGSLTSPGVLLDLLQAAGLPAS